MVYIYQYPVLIGFVIVYKLSYVLYMYLIYQYQSSYVLYLYKVSDIPASDMSGTSMLDLIYQVLVC